MMPIKRELLYGLALLPGVSIAGIAHAQSQPAEAQGEGQGDALNEIIVTAERRTTDVQDIAAAVSVRSGDELDEQGRYTTRQILEDIPGIVAVDNGTRNLGSADVQGNTITIRGIAPGNTAAGGLSGISAAAGTAVYVDGIYEGIGSGYDLQRVEVLRGPQGTLYGRSATTGVVAFYTQNPTMDAIGGDASFELGNYDLQHASAALNIPLSDTLAARVSGDYYRQGEGYYGEAVRGQQERLNGRIKLLWEPIETFSILLGAAYESRDSFGGGRSFQATLPALDVLTTDSIVVPGYKEQKQFWAEVKLDLGPATITYLPAFRSWNQDDTSIAVNAFNTGSNRRTTQTTPKDDFWTHELRLSSNNETGIHWQAGVFYYENKLLNNILSRFETPAGVAGAITTESRDDKSTRNIGVFAEATIPLTTALRLTLGGRYDATKIVVSEYLYDNDFQLCGNNIGVAVLALPPGATCTGIGTASVPSRGAVQLDADEQFNWFSYKARIEYDLSPDNLLYASLSTAYRPGDLGISLRQKNVLDKEKLTSIEFGSRNQFLDNSLQVNGALFYYNYQGFQTFYQTDLFVPGGFTNVNVPARNFGGELELLYRLTPRDLFGVNANYVESRWYDKPAGFAAAYPQIKRSMTPYTITANYQHRFDLPGGSDLMARIDGRYEAAHQFRDLQKQYLDVGADQYEYRHARVVGNLSAVWTSADDIFSISAYVRNFTNARFNDYTVTTNSVRGNNRRLTLDYTDPRTFGAQVAVRF